MSTNTPIALRIRPSSNWSRARPISLGSSRRWCLDWRRSPGSSRTGRSRMPAIVPCRHLPSSRRAILRATTMNEQSSLPNAISNVISDLADLFQKEVRLARAELSEKISITFRAGIWIFAAAILSIVAVLLAVQACVLALSAATGIALHWSSLIVAAILGVAASAVFAKGRADVPSQIAPDRAINQVKQDIAVAKEQFT